MPAPEFKLSESKTTADTSGHFTGGLNPNGFTVAQKKPVSLTTFSCRSKICEENQRKDRDGPLRPLIRRGEPEIRRPVPPEDERALAEAGDKWQERDGQRNEDAKSFECKHVSVADSANRGAVAVEELVDPSAPVVEGPIIRALRTAWSD